MKEQIKEYLLNQGFKEITLDTKYEWYTHYEDGDINPLSRITVLLFHPKHAAHEMVIKGVFGYHGNILDLDIFRDILKTNGFVEWTFERWLKDQGWSGSFPFETPNGVEDYILYYQKDGKNLFGFRGFYVPAYEAFAQNIDNEMVIVADRQKGYRHPQSEAAARELFEKYKIEIR